MKFPDVPLSAFIDPGGANRREVEALIRKALAMVLDYAGSATERSPLPDLADLPSPVQIPENPVPEAEILETLRGLMTNSMNAAHPAYMGHMDSLPTVMSVIGDLVVAALNNNMLSLEMSPVFSRLEVFLLREFAQLFGLGEGSGGMMLSGGSLANLEAVALARNVKLGVREKGVVGLKEQPVLFASEICHTSIHKAAMILGLGTNAVVSIPTDGRAKMDVAALRDAVAKARREGMRPFCVVATAGTTMTGNIDPIPELHAVAKENDCWLHVDAVYGGALMFSDANRHRLVGIENADSVSFNPQKWMYVTKACATLLLRDMTLPRDHFRVLAPYMRDTGSFINLGEISLHGTRHADILKLWLSLLHIGRKGFGEIIDTSYALMEHFVAEVKRRPFLHLAYEPEMNIVCFRSEPQGVAEDQLDVWNNDLQDYLLHKGNAFLSLPLLRGRRWLKAVLLNPYLHTKTITDIFTHLDAFHIAKR